MPRFLKSLLLHTKSYLLPILSGFFIGTSYIPFPPWASFFAFVPLWIFLLRQNEFKKVAIASLIVGFLLTLIGFNWVAFTLKEFGHLPWFFAVLGLLLFCLIANLYIFVASAMWFFIVKFFNKRGTSLDQLSSLLLLSLLTALLENSVPTIFYWNFGFPFLWMNWPVAQWAELIGFQGLSSLVILTNVLFFIIYTQRAQPQGRRLLVVFITVFIVVNGLGYGLVKTWPPADRVIRVALVQANIGNQEKQFAEKGYGFREHIVSRYIDLSNQAVKASDQPLDFIVWPETALPVEIENPEFIKPVLRPVVEWIQNKKIPLLTGGYGYDLEQNKTTNSFFIFEENGRLQWPFYFKSILLMFGEYIPFSDQFPQIKNWFPSGDFARGHGPEVFRLGDLKIGPQICYESLFSSFSRQLAHQGAHFIVNITNDSWYGEWQEPYQHGYMTFARAIETRRPLIRSTNTGISTVVLANGQVLKKSPMGKEWYGVYEVPYREAPGTTIYMQVPWLMRSILFMLIVLLLIKTYLRKPKES